MLGRRGLRPLSSIRQGHFQNSPACPFGAPMRMKIPILGPKGVAAELARPRRALPALLRWGEPFRNRRLRCSSGRVGQSAAPGDGAAAGFSRNERPRLDFRALPASLASGAMPMRALQTPLGRRSLAAASSCQEREKERKKVRAHFQNSRGCPFGASMRMKTPHS